MYNKVIIYDGYLPTSDGREFMRFPLEPLLTNLRKKWKEDNYPERLLNEVFRCPAFTNSLKNTFVHKAPYDVLVKYDKDKRFNILVPADYVSDDHLAKQVVDGVENNHDVQLFNGIGTRFLFANKSCEMTLEQPYYHNKNLTTLSGTWNIGRWFRPFHPGILNFGQKDFEIKRGDPLLYVKFPRDIKIEFRKTKITPDAYAISMGVGGFKHFVRRAPLETMYKYFESVINKKSLIKQLEQNRIK